MQGRQRSDRRAQPHAARPEVNEAAPLPHERAVPGAQPCPVSAVSAVPQAAPVPTPVPHQQSSIGSENMLDVDVTVLAFAQWVMELKNKSSNSQKSLQIELNTIKNAINGNHSDLADFKRHGAAIQQQMQSEINEIRESLSSVFMEITAAVRNNAAADQDLKMKIQMLNEQAVRNETAFAQLADAADQSQSKLRAAAQEMQQFSERMRDDLASLNQKTDTLQGTVLDRADQLKSETDQLSQDLRTQLEKRKVQLQKMVQDVVNIGESLQGLVNDFGGVKRESGATQTRLNSSLYSLDARRQQGTTAPAACQVVSSKFHAMPMAQEHLCVQSMTEAPCGKQRGMAVLSRPSAKRTGQSAQSVAKSSRRPKPKAALGAISEAAEWTEQSAAGRHDFDEELETMWAEAGAEDGATNSSAGKSCDAATVASRALAAASAARKGVLGVICSTGTADVSAAARRGIIESGGRLQTAELSFCKGASAATAVERGGSDPQDDSEEETSETSEEEVEMQEVSMPSRPVNSKPKVAADVLELDIDIGPEDPNVRSPTTARCTGKLSKAADAASGAINSPMRGRIMVGTDLETKVLRKRCEESCDTSSKTSVHAVETAKLSTSSSNKDTDGQAEDMKISSAEPAGQAAADAEIEKEWEEIAFRSDELAKEARESRGKAVAQQDALRKPICYKEVQSWLHDLSTSKEAATTAIASETEIEKPGRRPEEFVLSLKAMSFDFNDMLHYRLLHTMYSKLARCKVCPRIGSHWEVLGFQGTDPHTDLNRSGGLLNVVHMFFFFSHFFEIFKAAYLLSQDDQQHFPLAAVCINITKMVMDALAAGSFSSILDEIDQGAIPVAETTCLIFSGGLHHFYSRWRTQKRTIRDSEQTFKEVRALMCSQPATLLEELHKGSEHAAIGAIKADSAQVEFTNLGSVDPKEAQKCAAGESGSTTRSPRTQAEIRTLVLSINTGNKTEHCPCIQLPPLGKQPKRCGTPISEVSGICMACALQAVDVLALLIAAWAWRQLFLLACAASPSSLSYRSVLCVKAVLGSIGNSAADGTAVVGSASRWRDAIQKALKAAAVLLQSLQRGEGFQETDAKLAAFENEDASRATSSLTKPVPGALAQEQESGLGPPAHTCENLDAQESTPGILTDTSVASEAVDDGLLTEELPVSPARSSSSPRKCDKDAHSEQDLEGEADDADRDQSSAPGFQNDFGASVQQEHEPASPSERDSREADVVNTTAVLEEKCLETLSETASSAATQDQCRQEQSCTVTSPHTADPTEIALESPVADAAVEQSFESPIIAEYTRENSQSDRPELEQTEGADESKGKSAEATSAEASWRPSLRAVVSRKAEQATADDFEATEVEGDSHSLSEHAQARIWCRRDRGLDGNTSDSMQSSSSRGKPRRAFYKARQVQEA
ncbi:ELMOD3 [Symbiodinium sp. CCMP2592]|nr:ELMOD3 [Symbiodinium sp. CCMP2592]